MARLDIDQANHDRCAREVSRELEADLADPKGTSPLCPGRLSTKLWEILTFENAVVVADFYFGRHSTL